MSTTEEVLPHSETVTPSGIEIRYFTPPNRRYEVREKWQNEHRDWLPVPSVTTVLDILNKPALPWWGQGVAVEGVLELHAMGELRETYTASDRMGSRMLTVSNGDVWHPATKESVVQKLTERQLTVNHQRDRAGDRGTAVHDAFELWAREGRLPDPEMFPEEERGYVVGLNAFLADIQPEPLAAEVMVGSVEHGFAGRYDIRFQTSQEAQVVHHRTPKRGAQYATLKPGLFLGDLKTSSGVYTSHMLQLEAYEGASIECGYEPTEARGIIHVTAEGNYEFVRSLATYQDFLDVVTAYNALQGVEKRRKRK